MHHDDADDPYGFWNDRPTRPVRRTQVGSRAHGEPETRLIPVVARERAAATRPHNPLVRRVCLMVGAGLLVVPIALAMRDDSTPVTAAKLRSIEPMLLGTMPSPPTDHVIDTDAPSTTVATTLAATTAAPSTMAPVTEAAVTAAPTAPPTAPTAKKKAAVKPATTTAPAKAQAASAGCTATYTIAAGDAWSTIAARAKVSMTSLLAANNATVNTVLLPGKKICLPDGAVQPGPPTNKPPTTTAPPTTQSKPTPTTKPPATTAPATTAPGTTQPPSPANTYTRAEVTQIIRDVWPDSLENAAIAIATRESNLIPTVHNYCCYGLFQIYYNAHKTWLATIGVTSAAQLYDPRVNATAAYALYQNAGWAPWGGDPTATTTTVSG